MRNFDFGKIGDIGDVFTARLVSQMNSDKVSAVISGLNSHNTFIFDVTEHCKLPFERDRSEIGSDIFWIEHINDYFEFVYMV